MYYRHSCNKHITTLQIFSAMNEFVKGTCNANVNKYCTPIYTLCFFSPYKVSAKESTNGQNHKLF